MKTCGYLLLEFGPHCNSLYIVRLAEGYKEIGGGGGGGGDDGSGGGAYVVMESFWVVVVDQELKDCSTFKKKVRGMDGA